MARTGSDEGGTEPQPRFFDARWLYDGPDAVESVDADVRYQTAPDLFDRLRERRWLVARLLVEFFAVVAGVVLVLGVPVRAPLLGGAMIALGSIAIVIDLVVLWRLRRLVADAWTDLSRPPDI